MRVTDDIRYIGVNDHEVDLFEGQYIVPNGMAYNSYVILDEKTAVMDSVDARFGEEWLANLAGELGSRKPDYLIVQHMEPDHSANIMRFLEAWPEATVVSSAKAFQMMKNFYGSDLSDRKRIVVGDKDTLELGRHTLTFVTAPMVHWPEVFFTYDSTDRVLFSADAFGKFGALDVEDPEGWACEARRYYLAGRAGAEDHLPAARAGAGRKPCLFPGNLSDLELLRHGERGHRDQLYLGLRAYPPGRGGAGGAAAGEGMPEGGGE